MNLITLFSRNATLCNALAIFAVTLFGMTTLLAQTDWYVVRKTEVGTAIPADIQAKRLQARIDAEGDIANTEG